MSIERRFCPEAQFLRKIRRVGKPEITLEKSRTYLESKTKRNLDILVGSTLLLSSAPILLAAMQINKLLCPDQPALYKTDERIIKDGKKISIFKVRSMDCNGEPEKYFDQTDPKRTRRFGKFLRSLAKYKAVPSPSRDGLVAIIISTSLCSPLTRFISS